LLFTGRNSGSNAEPVPPKSFLIIQTAFTGDVILATALAEKLHERYPDAAIDFLVRKGNESLFTEHPFLRNVLIWNKKERKLRHLVRTIRQVRAQGYGEVINVQRFFSSGLITVFSRAQKTVGFSKNPLSLFFTRRVEHRIGASIHEVDRNQELIRHLSGDRPARPKLYPSEGDFSAARRFGDQRYVCIAPTSVWFTKQLPKEKWVALIGALARKSWGVALLGGPEDHAVTEEIKTLAAYSGVVNLTGQMTYLQSAAVMKKARMNFVNDSAPMHLASAVNAPVTAVYCSTVPAFGFGPLSSKRFIVETRVSLSCRPCGLHGFRSCPLRHFRCAWSIELDQLSAVLEE
jgi:heptosyltransferase-2